jgi:hypothetical protein
MLAPEQLLPVRSVMPIEKRPNLHSLFLTAFQKYRYAEPGGRSATMKSLAPTAGELEQHAHSSLLQPRQALIRLAWLSWPS